MESQILNRSWATGNGAPAHSGALPILLGLLQRAAAVPVVWLRRLRSRAQLHSILHRDARFYEDIGVPRATVLSEASKPFWRA